MLLGMAAATSALDLIKTLTQAGSSSKPTSGAKFSAVRDSSTTAHASGTSGPTSLISPGTMAALLTAQGHSDTSSATTGRAAALKAQMLTTATASPSVSVSV